MRKYFYTLLLSLCGCALGTSAQVTPASQMEKLDRGLTAVSTSPVTHFVSWRLLGTDDKAATTFDLLRDGEVIASNLTKTNYMDNRGSKTAQYQVVTRVNGEVTETSQPITPWGARFLTLSLDRPATGEHGGTYTPNDMSVGDVDGDGQYELFVKWDPSTSQDNGSNGVTDKVYIDCYRMDGTKLWRIDLGDNIRAGAHYTQFMVYDFDRDGRAEMICKTAPGSIDGTGAYVNQAATDAKIKGHGNNLKYVNSNGRILEGAEYLTVFSGLTGQALHTTWYLPGRAGTGSSQSTERGDELGKVSAYPASSFWGDGSGNRSERYLAAVAYLNGPDEAPCAVFSRGYYTKAYVWAVTFDGTRLHTEWLHASPNATQYIVFASKYEEGQPGLTITVDGDVLKRIPVITAPANTSGVTASDAMADDKGNRGIVGSNTLYSNGNHNLSIADVDGDGCDEILWGAAALNNDGRLLYATGYGHGDAIHVGKMIPDSADLYVFDIHEEKLNAKHGSWDLHNARTGRIIWHGNIENSDNGRGMAGDLTGKDGWEFWSSDNRQPRSAATGLEAISKSCSVNFRIYWDGSVADQLFDGNYTGSDPVAKPYIQKWNGSGFTNVIDFNTASYNNPQTCNTTKSTPCLQADILGDWREELIMWNKNDPSQIMIYATTIATDHAVPTLMHDHVYRMGICWQNTAYNQPPHLGYYLPDYVEGKLPSAIGGIRQHPATATEQTFDLLGRRTTGLQKGLNIVRRTTENGTTTQKTFVK